MPVETLDFGHGIAARIYHDSDCESPYEGDSAVKIVVLHRDFINPNPECGNDSDSLAKWEKEHSREWFIVPLYMYQHSGVALAAGFSNPFSCPWDSGQVGIVALKKSEWGRGKGERNAARLRYARGVAEEYGRWMNGECFYYVVEDSGGEILDSCAGFIGLECAVEAAREAAAYYANKAAEKAAVAWEDSRPDLYGAM